MVWQAHPLLPLMGLRVRMQQVLMQPLQQMAWVLVVVAQACLPQPLRPPGVVASPCVTRHSRLSPLSCHLMIAC